MIYGGRGRKYGSIEEEIAIFLFRFIYFVQMMNSEYQIKIKISKFLLRTLTLNLTKYFKFY